MIVSAFGSAVSFWIIGRQKDLEVITGFPAQHAAAADVVGAALRADLAAGSLVDGLLRQTAGQFRVHAGEVEDVLVAVAARRHARDARGDTVGDREVVGRAHVDTIEFADGEPDRASVVALRLLADVADGAADRATPEQRSLRPAQHLDVVEVHELRLRTQRERVVHVVDVDRDAGLESEVEVVLADAADERSHRVAEGGLSGTERGIRHRVRHVGGERECPHLQFFRVDRGDRDRDFLQPLLAVARGNDDLLERALPLPFGPAAPPLARRPASPTPSARR